MQLIALIQAGLLFAVIPAMAVSEPVTAPACGVSCNEYELSRADCYIDSLYRNYYFSFNMFACKHYLHMYERKIDEGY